MHANFKMCRHDSNINKHSSQTAVLCLYSIFNQFLFFVENSTISYKGNVGDRWQVHTYIHCWVMGCYCYIFGIRYWYAALKIYLEHCLLITWITQYDTLTGQGVLSLIKLTQDKQEFWFQFCIFVVRIFAIFVCPSVLSLSDLKLHKTYSNEWKTFYARKVVTSVNFCTVQPHSINFGPAINP